MPYSGMVVTKVDFFWYRCKIKFWVSCMRGLDFGHFVYIRGQTKYIGMGRSRKCFVHEVKFRRFLYMWGRIFVSRCKKIRPFFN